MVIQCPHCHARCRAKDDAAGAQLRCPTCHQLFSLPPSDAIAVMRDSLPTDPLGSGSPLLAGHLNPRRTRAAKKKTNKAIWYAFLGLATAVAVGCGGIVILMLAPHIISSRLKAQRDIEERGLLADSPDRPEWTVDSGVLEQLGPEVAFADHTLRLPMGFTEAASTWGKDPIHFPGGGTMHRWTWLGPRLPSGRHAVIEAEVRWPPKGKSAQSFFEAELPAELRAVTNSSVISGPEVGHVGGKHALRVGYIKASSEWDDLWRFEEHCQVHVNVLCPGPDRIQVIRFLQAAQLTVRQIGEPHLNSAPGL